MAIKMSWTSQLYKTYEENLGKHTAESMQMAPVAHMHAKTQIEVLLNLDGDFQGARILEKEDATTLIPVTEASEGRSSGVAPHALCDTLSYVAGDFEQYCETEKQKRGAREKYTSYISALGNWAVSEYSHPKVRAIYAYLLKRELISDLRKAGIVFLRDGEIFDERKIAGQPYEKALVRFRLLGSPPGQEGTWSDDSLIEAYVSYYQSIQPGRKDICYFTGRQEIISENHPKGIVAANYGAKLVSANDSQGYTYRGRFQNAEQAYAFSYVASQKIHRALTWLAKNKGAYIGTKDKRMFVCWNPNGRKVPDIFEEFGLIGDADDIVEVSYKKKLIKAFQGYRDQFQKDETIIVMGLDAATTGRLSVTYYSEQPANTFIDRILYWGETCNWYFLKFNEKKEPYYKVETPIFRRIVECAFGRERERENGYSYIEADDKVLKEQTQKLVKCMIEQQPIPFDIVQALVVRASMPMAYSRLNRERVLSTACAVIVKYNYDKTNSMKGEENEMKLDKTRRDRSYLFGRLLAILEKVERETFDPGEQREPNAIRLQSAYVNHPLQTWQTLDELLIPYFKKLPSWKRNFYKDQIGEVLALLTDEREQILNQSLGATYLLGYYLQRAELNNKKDIKKEEKENE